MRNFIIILTGALVLMTGCTSTKRNNYILLIDNSRSIKPELMDKYISIMEHNILPHIGRKDRLTIQFIDECSMTQSERVFHLDLAKMDFSQTTDGLNHAEDSINARRHKFLTDSIQAMLKNTILQKRAERKSCGSYTDIINALKECTSLICHDKSYKTTWDKIGNDAQGNENYEYQNNIIIFSDMVNENREKTLDFTQMGKFSPEQVYKKLEDLRAINKIPDLNGCNIFIYGATSTAEAGPYANRQIENVRLFWEIFFKDTGAKIQAYAYDSQREIQEYIITASE